LPLPDAALIAEGTRLATLLRAGAYRPLHRRFGRKAVAAGLCVPVLAP
jgi:hypothetical protein